MSIGLSKFLALAMKKLFWSLLPFTLMASCGNDSQPDAVLHQPPFDRLTDSIKQAPENADLYYRRGVLLYQNEHVGFAEQDLRTAWQLDPKEEYALSMTTLLRQKNPDSAIVFLGQALQKLPKSIALQVGLARGYQLKDEWVKALAICDTIISQHPNQIDALALKSEILQAQGKDKEALAVLEQAYSYAPFDPALAYELAYAYAEAKNSKALSLTEVLIKTDETEKVAQAYYSRGVYFDNIGNKAEAVKNFDAAIRSNYNFMDAYLDKGIVFYEQKKFAEALKTFEMAQTISPSSAAFYYWIGKTQEAMGDKGEAKLNYQRAFGLDQTMAEAKEAAARL